MLPLSAEVIERARAALVYPAPPNLAAALAELTGNAYYSGPCQVPGDLNVSACNRATRARELRAFLDYYLESLDTSPDQMDTFKTNPEYHGQTAVFDILPGVTVKIGPLGKSVTAEEAEQLTAGGYGHLLAEAFVDAPAPAAKSAPKAPAPTLSGK